MALFRAMETSRPTRERLFHDPYAIHFLDGRLRFITKLSARLGFRKMVERYIHNKIPGALTSGLARTRYIDDQLQEAAKSGAKQLILLGAGFDMRSLRLGFMETIQTIEIDHPNTSNYKLNILRTKHGMANVKPATAIQPGSENNSTRYCQIDFNSESLDALSNRVGLNFDLPSVIIWEGVTNYLTSEAVKNTFRWIGRFAPGSFVIFTYVHQDILDRPGSFYRGEKLLKDLDKIEERWTFGLRPEEVTSYLRQFSLELLHDVGADEYRAMYIPERTEKGYEFYRVAVARRGLRIGSLNPLGN